MPIDPVPAETHTHRKSHPLQKFEGFADLLVVGMAIALAVAIVIGLVTANGNIHT